jgi:hypothetical protein
MIFDILNMLYNAISHLVKKYIGMVKEVCVVVDGLISSRFISFLVAMSPLTDSRSACHILIMVSLSLL